jgi:hypothetical protein
MMHAYLAANRANEQARLEERSRSEAKVALERQSPCRSD